MSYVFAAGVLWLSVCRAVGIVRDTAAERRFRQFLGQTRNR